MCPGRHSLQDSTTIHDAIGDAPPLGLISALVDALGTPVFVCGRSGRILVANEPAKHCIEEVPNRDWATLNLFGDLLHVDAKIIAEQLETGEQELSFLMERPNGRV